MCVSKIKEKYIIGHEFERDQGETIRRRDWREERKRGNVVIIVQFQKK